MKAVLTMVVTSLVTLALLGCASQRAAQAERDSEAISQPSQSGNSKVDDRWREIAAEIGGLTNHPWAGQYYRGDGLAENVSFLIAPTKGFAFVWTGCLGVYGQNYGRVNLTNGILCLQFSTPQQGRRLGSLEDEFIPVKWGERTYLIPPNKVTDFCNNVNTSFEPRMSPHGMVLLRRGDEKKKVSGKPSVPPEFRGYLLDQPIRATIISVGKVSLEPSISTWRFKNIEVKISAGKTHGVKLGMEFHVIAPSKAFDTVTITAASENEAIGIISQIGEDSPMPKPGWKVSTAYR